MKIILDSNIIIYSLQPQNENLSSWLKDHTLHVSSITQLEVLGYHKITKDEISFAQRYFSNCGIISIQQNIIEKAISFRQVKSMSLADAIIAATAQNHNLPLITANTKDFKHIENLEIIDPLSF